MVDATAATLDYGDFKDVSAASSSTKPSASTPQEGAAHTMSVGVSTSPRARATSRPADADHFSYSAAVLVRFAACFSLMGIGLILGLMSFYPGAKVLLIGTLVSAMIASLLGWSGSERAHFERSNRAK